MRLTLNRKTIYSAVALLSSLLILFSACKDNKAAVICSENDQDLKPAALNTIINMDDVASVAVKSTDSPYITVTDADAKVFIDFLNSAEYDRELNDGRMMKMVANDYDILIKMNTDSEVDVKVWPGQHIKIDTVWYIPNFDFREGAYEGIGFTELLEKYTQNNQ